MYLYKELCCSICHYNNLYNNHKVLLISDELQLKRENITIESFTTELNTLVEKTISLKNKIEKEILEINNLYEKVDNEVTKTYLARHEKLTKEENDLKEKLQNEVTKVKEKLEYYLSDSNNQIKMSEKIQKGIKVLEKENQEEKNNIKFLSYITKINKTQKNMKHLFQQLMRNIKISFQEENSTIKYDEYYFNGIPSPKNIEFKDITSCSVNLNWKIDNLNILNIDNKQIKYKVEMRKENKKFINVYEGNNNTCCVENLKKNTNYEFRICSLYNNDLIGSWTEIQKVKTNEFECDSIILLESRREKEFIRKLYEWSGYNKLVLIYRGTRDGVYSNNFHTKCDNQGPTIILCKHEKGYIFGGYSSISWTSKGGYCQAPDSFLFTLTNIHGTEPTKFLLKNNNDINSVCHDASYLAIFGGGNDLYIQSDFLNKFSICNFPYSYKDSLGKGKSIFSGDNDANNFKIKEVEVFKLFK